MAPPQRHDASPTTTLHTTTLAGGHAARAELEKLARAHGFHEVRFAVVRRTPRADALDRWLARGDHADMHYLSAGRDARADPRFRMPSARTAMVLATDHHHRRPPDPGGRTGMVARYAWGRDYHNLVGKRLKRLRRELRSRGVPTWGAVDTAPILERAWAAASGLGFQGKSGLVIRPGTTSWTVLAIVFLPVAVPVDPPLGDHCGRCRRCLDACPTAAFRGPYELDARRCISYWTIEARGLAPRHLRDGFGRWVFGCDVCQEVCPHNHHPPDPDEDDLRPVNAWLDLDELLASDDDALMQRFTGTPLRRPRAEGLKRNALIVLGNLGDDRVVDQVTAHGLTHRSPVVRAAAMGCLRRLGASVEPPDDHPLVVAEAAW